jgi:DNA helicase HerA-like ATPase
MSLFEIIPDLRIGSIVEVAGSEIKVELDGSIAELTRTYGGRVYPIGQFASIVKIHFGRRILVAYVRLLRMRSELSREQGLPPPPAAEDSRILQADLFGEATWDEKSKSLDFRRGVRNYPLPGQAVHLTTQDELRKVYEGAEHAVADACDPMLPLGSYVGAEGTTCYANLDKLFGLHCAVLGSTGAGKSGTVTAILHSLLEHKARPESESTLRPRVIIIDPHGEYAAAFGTRAVVLRAYNLLAAEEGGGKKAAQLRLPYWMMTGEEFRDLIIAKTEYEATSENNIVYKALTHSRLVQRNWAKQSDDWEGKTATAIDPSEPRPVDANAKSLIAEYDRDTPDPFSLDEFMTHIKKEQGVRNKSGKWEAYSPSDFKSHASVLDKLAVLRSDPRLKFMMAEYKTGDPDLPEILEQFVGEIDAATKADVRIVDISGLPNEVAGPLTAAIARLLCQYKVWQTRKEREHDPILLVCEEAHRYVPDAGLAEYQSAQKAIRRIAKEGRKYGLGLMLVSQRPADVERTVLSQCNSWLVMRLTNATDQEHVNRFLPDSLAGLARLLPSLSRQEAIFVGEAAAVPARILIRDLKKEQLPDSGDISFTEGWAEPPCPRLAIQAVVKRWRRETSPGE